MPKKHKAKKHAGGRPKLTAACALLNPQHIRALSAYNEAREAGKGYNEAIEAGTRDGMCKVTTLKKLLWNFQPTRTELRRLLKQQGLADTGIEKELALMDENGGPFGLVWRRSKDGFDMSYAPTQPPARKKRSRNLT
ncbi:MAG: hypothetical protein KGQ73_04110 [Gammaproteobacteria bacterium]|nr:hypothetical protein [Gammaproteobacteria bacterium]